MNNDEKKKNDGFANGVTLIVIGVIALIVTFFDFEIDWHLLWEMWPLLLIIIGVCIMPINRWVKLAVILFLVAVGLVAYNHKTEHVTKVINKIEMRSSHFNDCD